MASGLTDPARQVTAAVRPVLSALARGTPGVNADDVDDLVSQVVEKVLCRLAAGAEIHDLGPYSKQAARHIFYDHVGQRGGGELAPSERAADVQGGDPWIERVAQRILSDSPSDQVIAREDARRHQANILWAFQHLSVEERSILFLRHDDGLDGEEIAELLAYRNAAVVDSLASRARTKLRRYLSPTLQGWVDGR